MLVINRQPHPNCRDPGRNVTTINHLHTIGIIWSVTKLQTHIYKDEEYFRQNGAFYYNRH